MSANRLQITTLSKTLPDIFYSVKTYDQVFIDKTIVTNDRSSCFHYPLQTSQGYIRHVVDLEILLKTRHQNIFLKPIITTRHEDSHITRPLSTDAINELYTHSPNDITNLIEIAFHCFDHKKEKVIFNKLLTILNGAPEIVKEHFIDTVKTSENVNFIVDKGITKKNAFNKKQTEILIDSYSNYKHLTPKRLFALVRYYSTIVTEDALYSYLLSDTFNSNNKKYCSRLSRMLSQINYKSGKVIFNQLYKISLYVDTFTDKLAEAFSNYDAELHPFYFVEVNKFTEKDADYLAWFNELISKTIEHSTQGINLFERYNLTPDALLSNFDFFEYLHLVLGKGSYPKSILKVFLNKGVTGHKFNILTNSHFSEHFKHDPYLLQRMTKFPDSYLLKEMSEIIGDTYSALTPFERYERALNVKSGERKLLTYMIKYDLLSPATGDFSFLHDLKGKQNLERIVFSLNINPINLVPYIDDVKLKAYCLKLSVN